MRRLIAIGALALLVLAAVPFASAGSTAPTKHVDGTIQVLEPAADKHGEREWLARFEVRTTAGGVQFGYMHLYGVSGDVTGQIHEFSVNGVDYYRTDAGAQGATLWVEECLIKPAKGCLPPGDYVVSDGGTVDTFMPQLGWVIESGNISIYTTGQDS